MTGPKVNVGGGGKDQRVENDLHQAMDVVHAAAQVMTYVEVASGVLQAVDQNKMQPEDRVRLQVAISALRKANFETGAADWIKEKGVKDRDDTSESTESGV